MFRFALFSLALSFGIPAPAQVQRGITPARPAASEIRNGAYYALIVGIDRYPHEPTLQTPVNDAKAMDGLLRASFRFKTKVLLDGEATRSNILGALNQYRRSLTPDDSLLIYYAGHGTRDGGKAYWLPVDAEPDSTANWIIADDITSLMQEIPARHILLISDSCYSGGMSRDARTESLPSDHNAAIAKLLSTTSRILISSGRDEPVADSGGGDHSVFAAALLRGFAGMHEDAFSATSLFAATNEAVIGHSNQVPLYRIIQDSGHEGGDFVFLRPGAVVDGTTPSPKPAELKSGAVPSPAVAPTEVSPTSRPRIQSPKPPDFPKPPPPDPSGAVPLTQYRTALLMLHDAPQLLSDDAVVALSRAQVSAEQGVWSFIDPEVANRDGRSRYHLNPSRPVFVYEWQKLITQNPTFARGPLMDLFLRPDADWSFLPREKGWNDHYDVIADAFVFSKDQILEADGKSKDVEFTARRLAPVARDHLMLAASKAPRSLYFTVLLPTADYDFATSSMRFMKGGSSFLESFDLLTPVSPPLYERPMGSQTGYLFPAAARSRTNYQPWSDGRSIIENREDVFKPGIVFRAQSPAEQWRDNFLWMAKLFPTSLYALSLDRPLRLSSIPMDAKAAEAAHRMMNNLRAQVFVKVTGTSQVEWVGPTKQIPYALLMAHVEKVKIIDRDGGVLATVNAQSLPAAGGH